MIGYYAHHHGRGHLSRALAIAAAWGEPVTGLSSLPPPPDWTGPWVPLARDDGGPEQADLEQADPSAHGRLHWVPLRDAGLSTRMAAISAWIARVRPAVLVVDVSVEIALLARLHGVPVVGVVLPGARADAAHGLGFDVATALLAAWPAEAHGMVQGLSDAARRRLHPVGAITRHALADDPPGIRARRRVLVLAGKGGDVLDAAAVAAAGAATPEWSWRHIGGSGRWVDDPASLVRDADVVVSHAGEGAIAEISAARRPAVVLPQERPHGEQAATARVLAEGGWPVLVPPGAPHPGDWRRVLADAARLDGAVWARWNDGLGAQRAAAVIRQVADRVDS